MPTQSLQQRFLDSSGAPLQINGDVVVQLDRVQIPTAAVVTVTFVGERVYLGNAAVLAVEEPGKIRLSNGDWVGAVQIWDEDGLPRQANHYVLSGGRELMVYNKYRIRHSPEFITEDSFTGNAGIVVTALSTNRNRYECSNGIGSFNRADLVFELSWAEAT